jgi:hypothetical protein
VRIVLVAWVAAGLASCVSPHAPPPAPASPIVRSAPARAEPANVVFIDGIKDPARVSVRTRRDKFDAGPWTSGGVEVVVPGTAGKGAVSLGIRDDQSPTIYYVDATVYYEGDWRLYHRASLPGGDSLRLLELDRNVVSCAGGYDCLMEETVRVILSAEQFAAGPEFKVVSRAGEDFVVAISPEVAAAVLDAHASALAR